MSDSQQPTANSQQPTANSQQPTANSQQPTANSQQPTANSWSDLPLHFLTAPSSVGAEQRFGGSGFLFAPNAPWCDGYELLGGGEKHLYGSTEFLPVGRIQLCYTENLLCHSTKDLKPTRKPLSAKPEKRIE